jgi:hypothetical protein
MGLGKVSTAKAFGRMTTALTYTAVFCFATLSIDLTNNLTSCIFGSLQGNLGPTLDSGSDIGHFELGDGAKAFLSSAESFVLLRFGQAAKRASYGMD